MSRTAAPNPIFEALGIRAPAFRPRSPARGGEASLQAPRLDRHRALRESGIEPLTCVAARRLVTFAAGRAPEPPRRARGGFDFEPFRVRAPAFRPRRVTAHGQMLHATDLPTSAARLPAGATEADLRAACAFPTWRDCPGFFPLPRRYRTPESCQTTSPSRASAGPRRHPATGQRTMASTHRRLKASSGQGPRPVPPPPPRHHRPRLAAECRPPARDGMRPRRPSRD